MQLYPLRLSHAGGNPFFMFGFPPGGKDVKVVKKINKKTTTKK